MRIHFTSHLYYLHYCSLALLVLTTNLGKTIEHCLVIVIACDLFDFFGGSHVNCLNYRGTAPENCHEFLEKSHEYLRMLHLWSKFQFLHPSFPLFYLSPKSFQGNYLWGARSQKIAFIATPRLMCIQKRRRLYLFSRNR